MRKIKKFKIPIYLYEITRKAKKNKINVEELGFKEQNSFKEFVSSILSSAQPATVFDFFPQDFPPNSSQISAMPELPFSAGVLTLGSEMQGKINGIENPQLKELALISIKVFTDTGINLISELILQEAELEGCKLGPVRYVLPGPDILTQETEKEQDIEQAIQSVLRKLECSKIGVRLENKMLLPEHSVLFSIPWISKKKSPK
jgi:hypothetical protein